MIDLRAAKLPHDLMEHPWEYNFLQVCRWIEAKNGHLPRIGEELHPQNELLRLGQTPSVTFAPREIDAASLEGGRLHIRQFGLGLYGPSGPLPLDISEEIHERQLQIHDNTLADFLDLFHHRWLSLFYRACAQGQSAAGLDRSSDERFSMYVAALLGHHPAQTPIRQQAMPDRSFPEQAPPEQAPPEQIPSASTAEAFRLQAHARLSAAGHLVRHSRNPAGVTATLENYFAMPFRLVEYSLQWLRLERDDRVRLGCRGVRHHLGINTVVGHSVPDKQSTVTLYAQPQDFITYERLLPGNDWHARLTHWLRCFTGLELRWELRLSLAVDKVPPCRLGAHVKLGRTGWLTSPDRLARPDRLAAGTSCSPQQRLAGRSSTI